MVVLSTALGCCCCCVAQPLRRWMRVLRQIVLACARFYLWSIVMGEVLYLVMLFLFGPVGVHWDVQSAARGWDLGIEERLLEQRNIPKPTVLDNAFTLVLGLLSPIVTTLRAFLNVMSAAKSVVPAMQPEIYEDINRFWASTVGDMVQSIIGAIIWSVNYIVNSIYGGLSTLIPPSFRGEPVWMGVVRLCLFLFLLFLVSKTPTLPCKRRAPKGGGRADSSDEEEDEEEGNWEAARWRRRWRDHSAPPSSRTRGRSRDRRRDEGNELNKAD